VIFFVETPVGYDFTPRNSLPPLPPNSMNVWEPQKIEFTNTFSKSLPYHVNGNFPSGVAAGSSVGFPLSQGSYPYMEQPFGSSFVKQSNGESFADSNKAILSGLVFFFSNYVSFSTTKIHYSFIYIETNIASILLSFPENQYSAGAHPERLHESVLESICYLVDRMCETIIIGASQTVSLNNIDSEQFSSSAPTKHSAQVLPSDIFFYLKTHFGYNVEPNKNTPNI
jgi:hypothetical protein